MTEQEAAPLIAVAKAGDLDAFGKLAEAVEPELLRSISISREFERELAAEDVVQEAYLLAIGKISALEGATLATLIAWLKTIASRAYLDMIRALDAIKRGGDFTRLTDEPITGEQRPVFLDQLIHDSSTPSRIAIKAELKEALQQSLAKLPAIHQDVLRGRFIEGQSIRELATSLDISEAAVVMRLVRALDKVRTIILTDNS